MVTVNYHLADLVDLSLARKMVDAHYRAAGMPMGIIDALDGSILVSAGWQDICTRFHRVNPSSRRRCEESDNYIKSHSTAEQSCAYKCANGLWDIGIPIRVAGRHLATIFLGQFFYDGETPDREFFRKQAREFKYSEDEYLSALDKVPVFSRAKVEYILAYNKALSGFIADIGERTLRKIEQDKELWFANTLLKAQQEKSPDGMLIADDQQRMISFNRKFVEMWNIPAEVMASGSYTRALRSVRRILARPDEYVALVKTVHEHIDRESLHEIALNDGRIFEQFSAPLFGPHGTYYGRFWNFRDITKRKQAEEILQRDKDTLEKLVRESARELAEAQIKVEQSKRLSDVGMLASSIAHEIRNPLAAIKAAVYNIKKKIQGPRIDRHLATIDRKVGESDLIIQNLLSFASVKEPRYEPVPLRALIEECLDTVLQKNAGGAVEIRKKLLFTESDAVEADPTHMRILILNIIDNAFQSLADKKGRVTLTGKRTQHSVEIEIRDTGIGIAAEDLQKIFEPFFTRKSRGTGLGLTISRQIVDCHHGKLKIISKKDSGTSVRIVLPHRQA